MCVEHGKQKSVELQSSLEMGLFETSLEEGRRQCGSKNLCARPRAKKPIRLE